MTSPFAANLALLMTRRDMGSIRLAACTDLCERRIRRLARGDYAPRLNEIPVLAEALGVAPADLAWLPTDELARRVWRAA